VGSVDDAVKRGAQRTLEGLDVDVGDEGVEGLSSILLLVALALEADADAEGDGRNATGPDELVEAGVNADIAGGHGALSEGEDLLDGTGSALLGVPIQRDIYVSSLCGKGKRMQKVSEIREKRMRKGAQGERGKAGRGKGKRAKGKSERTGVRTNTDLS